VCCELQCRYWFRNVWFHRREIHAQQTKSTAIVCNFSIQIISLPALAFKLQIGLIGESVCYSFAIRLLFVSSGGVRVEGDAVILDDGTVGRMFGDTANGRKLLVFLAERWERKAGPARKRRRGKRGGAAGRSNDEVAIRRNT
jgi:hypothetical protein